MDIPDVMRGISEMVDDGIFDTYVMTRNLHDEFQCFEDRREDRPYFVYGLGPAIKPKNPISSTGIYRNGRVWAMLDTLLVCDTIADARRQSIDRVTACLRDARQ